MSFPVKDWKDIPAALEPTADETVHEWRERVAAYAAEHPGEVTELDAAGLEDMEQRLSDYTDQQVAPLAVLTGGIDGGSPAEGGSNPGVDGGTP